MTLELGILLALVCAFATNLGFFYKHRGACACAPVEIKHPLRSGRAFEQRFSARRMANDYLALYETLIARRKPVARFLDDELAYA